MTSNAIILTSTLITAVPAIGMAVYYSLRVNWRATSTGRAIFWLFLTTGLSLGLSACVRLFPGFFADPAGTWTRVGVRVAIFIVLMNLWIELVHAQREGRRQADADAAENAQDG